MPENSRKVARNSRHPDFAGPVADLIASWRAEVSDKKDYGIRIATAPLAEWFRRVGPTGISAELGACTILACEWTFRVRRATEEDIEQVLFAMERSLCSPEKRILNRLQAHLLMKALEDALRKQMSGVRVPIALGFFSESAFSPYDWTNTKREAPKRVIPAKRGRLPILGPILAGVVVDVLSGGEVRCCPVDDHGSPVHAVMDALSVRKVRGGAVTLGQELCSILLGRRVLALEFSNWRNLLGATTFAGYPLPTWMAQRMRSAHRRIFEQDGYTIERFLEACKIRPAEIIWSFLDPEVVRAVFSIEWGRSKKAVKVAEQKGRVPGGRSAVLR